MLRLLAKIISVAAHPLLISIFSLVFLFYGDTPWNVLPNWYKSVMIITVGLGTSLVPLIIIAFLIVLNVVTDAEMPSRSERLSPLMLSSVSAVLTCFFASRYLSVPAVVYDLIFALTAMLIVASLVTHFWKISLHAMGAGALVMFVYATGVIGGYDFFVPLCIAFALAGCIGWARLYLEAHTPTQLFAGLCVGVVCVALSYFVI